MPPAKTRQDRVAKIKAGDIQFFYKPHGILMPQLNLLPVLDVNDFVEILMHYSTDGILLTINRYSHKATMTLAMYYLTEEDKQEILRRERNKSLEEMAHGNQQNFIRRHLGMEDGLYPDQLGLTIENKVVFGGVEEQILEHSVSSNCDLIVMGAQEKPFLRFATTLPKRVMRRSKVPVAVVPVAGEKRQPTGFLPSFPPQFSAARPT